MVSPAFFFLKTHAKPYTLSMSFLERGNPNKKRPEVENQIPILHLALGASHVLARRHFRKTTPPKDEHLC
jgi:hypothetical protein